MWESMYLLQNKLQYGSIQNFVGLEIRPCLNVGFLLFHGNEMMRGEKCWFAMELKLFVISMEEVGG